MICVVIETWHKSSFPPLLMKLSLPINFSKVSTQSEAKPGQITNKFFIPDGKFLVSYQYMESTTLVGQT